MSNQLIGRKEAALPELLVKVDGDDLLRAAKAVSFPLRTSDRIMPCLRRTRIALTPEGLELGSTDLQNAFRCVIQTYGRQGAGAITLPRKTLLELARSTRRGEQVTLSTSGSRLVFAHGKRRVRCTAESDADFVALPSVQGFEPLQLDRKLFFKLLQHAQAHCSKDDARPHLSGVLLDLPAGSSEMRLISTDGHRLTIVQMDVLPRAERISWLIPLATTKEFVRILRQSRESQVTMGYKDKKVLLRAGSYSVIGLIIDAAFPPWEFVTKDVGEKKLTVQTEDLRDALFLVKKRGRHVVVRIRGHGSTMNLSFQDGRTEEEIEESIPYSGDPIDMGFSGLYLSDAVSSLSEETMEVRFSGELSQAQFTSGPLRTIVMPCRG